MFHFLDTLNHNALVPIQDESADPEFCEANTNWMFFQVLNANIEQLIFDQGYQSEK